MGRYTGPVCRLCRRAGEKLFLKGDRCQTPKCAIERRGTPPGVHAAGSRPRRRTATDRGLQLREKQKARQGYGLLERQFRKYFREAQARPENTGLVLLQYLERRLDNVAYRVGFGESRAQARQMVCHGLLTVNGRKCDIPSRRLRPGDEVGWREGATRLDLYKRAVRDVRNKPVPEWLELDLQKLQARVIRSPERQEIDTHVNEQTIVEFYAR